MSAFGTSNATSGSSSSTGLFGVKPATGGGLFAAPAATLATGGASGNQGGVAPTGSAGTSASPSTGLFGSTSNATTPAASTSIFGSKSPVPASTTSSGTGAFGMANTTTAGSTSTGPFGASSVATPASTASGMPTTNPLFGGFPKPADTNTTSTAKPAGTSSTMGTGSAPAAGSFFSQPAKPDAASSTINSAPSNASSNLFGGGLFGAKSPATQAATASTPALSIPTTTPSAKDFFAKPPEQQKDATPVAPTTGGSLFGAKPADPKDSSGTPQVLYASCKTDIGAATSTTPLGGLFGKPTEKKDSSVPPSAALAASTTTSGGQTSTGLSVVVAPPSTLKGKTIEEIVNRWSSDLETHVREFNKFATEVAVWDRTLIDNSNTLNTLYSHVEAAEREQNDIDQSLDHIEQQQNELVTTLAAYEKVAQEILGSQGGSMRALDTGPADTERDKK
ncbi:hypothetical protein C0993_002590 [Termitomyces sp. T159_Od127]|nr:hypothetical protein C0993_002590 [Termitomyces sp. T159_Od127]